MQLINRKKIHLPPKNNQISLTQGYQIEFMTGKGCFVIFPLMIIVKNTSRYGQNSFLTQLCQLLNCKTA